MKWLQTLPIATALFVLSSCSSKELSRQKAFDLIKQGMNYPITLDYDVFTGDPDAAKKLLDSGLEAKGYVIVQRTQRLMDMGKPWVTLTAKSTPFLLPGKPTDKQYLIQCVRVGEADISEVTGIKMLGDGKKAVVEYTTHFTNLTPFAVMRGITPERVNTEKAYFALYDDGWRLEKKPGLDFLTE